MNDSSYTILIPALLLLSAAMVGMLYARFVSRSRENSEEIDFVDVELIPSRISVAEAGSRQVEADPSERVPFLEPRPEAALIVEVAAGTDEKEEEKSGNRETEYFDELQEAAAGLAALMRSSPVGKTVPVVYAPEEAEEFSDPVQKVEDEPQEILLPVAEALSEVLDETEVDSHDDFISDVDPVEPLSGSSAAVPIVEEKEERSVDLLIEDSPVTESLSEVEHSAEVSVSEPEEEGFPLRALLGDEVVDQLDSLDTELDSLETLVVSIESALSSLNEGHREVNSEDDVEIVSEAA